MPFTAWIRAVTRWNRPPFKHLGVVRLVAQVLRDLPESLGALAVEFDPLDHRQKGCSNLRSDPPKCGLSMSISPYKEIE
jgi:hypothetical protein